MQIYFTSIDSLCLPPIDRVWHRQRLRQPGKSGRQHNGSAANEIVVCSGGGGGGDGAQVEVILLPLLLPTSRGSR